ncbi:PAS domain-containing protein [bacterium]|nr:PAS domain-containing protein [bacterium]
MDLPYRDYFDEMPCYLTVQDRNLRVITANRRFIEDFGDYKGRYCYQVYKGRSEKCEVCTVEKTFRDGQQHSSEEQVRCLDGTDVSVIVYTTPIRNKDGEIIAVMEMSTDITEIKALQKQFRESQNRYKMLFEEVPCFISIQDADLNIVHANRLHLEAFGNSLGRKCFEAYKHRTEECYPCTVRQTFADGEVHFHEEMVTSLQGKTMNVLVHTAPIRDATGKIINVIEMTSDITQIRELQDQLASIGLLIGSISHGIKGLLNGLNGGIYLVNKGLQNDNRDRLEKGWEIVMRNINRIRSMVLDILYYAKDREMNWEHVSILDLADEVIKVVETKATELNIDLKTELQEDSGKFDVDAKAIRSLLINLLENSLDACRVDRKKDHHQVCFRLKSNPDEILFEVEDNGIGMEQETKEKAFSLFFSSKGHEGTGLGLFIANKIANSHGGSIQIDSEAGKGSKFTVTIPRRSVALESIDPK